MSITKEMTIGEVVKKYPQTVPVFHRYGMSCLGCPATQFENVEQGAIMHGIDIQQLIEELNKAASK
jgi:hybrid cluster-associated redox disulfide protein